MTKIKQSIILIKSGSYFEFVFRNSFRNAEPILCAEAGFGLEQKEESWIFGQQSSPCKT